MIVEIIKLDDLIKHCKHEFAEPVCQSFYYVRTCVYCLVRQKLSLMDSMLGKSFDWETKPHVKRYT